MITIQAPAKLNLRLCVLAREAGGYHQIETIFCRIGLADTLEIRPADEAGVALTVHGAHVGPAQDNLVVRAVHAFSDAAGVRPALSITLHKRIPAGAGLGGGSSDAAAMLLALNRMHGDVLQPDALRTLGARLGSDVPFFLADAPLAVGWGRGERLLAMPAPAPAPALVCVPAAQVATADAYRRLSESLADAPPASLLTPDDLASWHTIARVACNDFERVVLPDIPLLVPALALLRSHGAVIAHLTGSGSAIFGIFDNVAARDAAQRALADAEPTFELHATDAAV